LGTSQSEILTTLELCLWRECRITLSRLGAGLAARFLLWLSELQPAGQNPCAPARKHSRNLVALWLSGYTEEVRTSSALMPN